jgi:hypothetical protein
MSTSLKGQEKGKGKSHSRSTGNSNSTPCGYCQNPGHEARECRKRLYDEKQKYNNTVTNNSQHPTHLHVDETALMFSSNAVFACTCDDHGMDDMNQNGWDDNNDHIVEEDNHSDITNEDTIDAHTVDETTYRHLWQIQMIPSLLALRTSGPGHLIHNKQDDQTIHPPTTTSPPNMTYLVMDKLLPHAETSLSGLPSPKVGHYPQPSMGHPHQGEKSRPPSQ